MSIFERGLICLMTATYLCACAPVPVAGRPTETSSETHRLQIGSIGVIAYPTDPEPALAVRTGSDETSATTKTALRTVEGGLLGGLAGALVGAYIAAGTVVGLLYVDKLIAAGASIGIVVGAAKGAAKSEEHGAVNVSAPTEPFDKIGEVDIRTLRSIAPTNPNEKLRSAVVDAAFRSGLDGVTETTAAIPSEIQDANSSQPLNPDAESDALLEVRVVSVELIGSYGSVDLTLHIDATMRIVDAATSHEIYRGDVLTYEDGPRDSSEWNADAGRMIKEGIENASRILGQRIVDKLPTITKDEY